jgi:hypothetical protein
MHSPLPALCVLPFFPFYKGVGGEDGEGGWTLGSRILTLSLAGSREKWVLLAKSVFDMRSRVGLPGTWMEPALPTHRHK